MDTFFDDESSYLSPISTLSTFTPYHPPHLNPPPQPTHHPHPTPNPTQPKPQCRIYTSVNWVSIGSGNDLSPVLRQAITWTNVDILPELDKLQWNSNQNTKLFIDENAVENVVCEMAAILSRGRWVKRPSETSHWSIRIKKGQ